MQYKIKPYIGAGKLLLGMTSKEMEKVMQKKPRKFKKFIDDEFNTDAYKEFYVYYKTPGICEAIEFHEPAMVLFNDMNLVGESYEKVKKLFLLLDENVELEDAGLTSYKYGIGIYAPHATSEPSEAVEGVILFEKGYYD